MANSTIQTVKLNIKDFTDNYKKMNDQVKQGIDNQSKDFDRLNYALTANQNNFKKWGAAAVASAEDFGKSFTKNLGIGAKALTLDLGRDLLKGSLKDAASMAVDASSRFALMKSRLGLTSDEITKFQKNVRTASVNTRADFNQMSAAFDDLSDVASPQAISGFTSELGQGLAINGGNGDALSAFLKDTLQGQGKEINKANVGEEIGGADLLRRNGKGFGHGDDAFKALSDLNQKDVTQSGMSPRDLASMISGASQANDPKRALAAVSDLLSANSGGKLNALGAILGGPLTGANGKMDLSALGGAKAMALTHQGGDDKTSLAIFKSIMGQSGVSEKGAEGLFNMIRGFDKVSASAEKVEADNRSLADSAKDARDSLEGAYTELKDNMVSGFADIFGGLEQPLKDLMAGKLGDAFGGLGHAASSGISGIADHPGLVAAGIGSLLIGGGLIGSLMKNFGGAAGGLAGSIGMGKALQQIGVTPVYVVNAADIKNGGSSGIDAVKGLLGMGEESGVPKAGGFLGKLGGLLGGVGASVGEIGATGVGTLATGGLAGLASLVGGVGIAGAGGYLVGQGINKAGDMAFGNEGIGGALYDLIDYLKNGKDSSKIEIDVKHPGFSAAPKATDPTRGGN